MNPNQAQFGGSFQQPPQQQPKGCLGRNWKWMLPVGCLGLIIGLVALGVGVFFIAMSALKSSEVYQGALKMAQSSPAAIERLGEPIKDGWIVKGNVRFTGDRGSANIDIPVSGPKNSGTLHVWAATRSGEWTYEKLDLEVEGGETVSLLESGFGQTPPGSSVDVEEDADDASEDAEKSEPEASEDSQTTDSSDERTINGGVLNGKAISKPQPAYPPIAKAARASGVVTVKGTVDETGRVIEAEAVSGHPLLQQAAVQAARQAKFSPTLQNGEPVRVSGLLIYNFVLE